MVNRKFPTRRITRKILYPSPLGTLDSLPSYEYASQFRLLLHGRQALRPQCPHSNGGRGPDGIINFYRNHLVGKMPLDTKVEKVSRTVGGDQVGDELILSFTHDREIDFTPPAIPPLGSMWSCRRLLMKFEALKIIRLTSLQTLGALCSASSERSDRVVEA